MKFNCSVAKTTYHNSKSVRQYLRVHYRINPLKLWLKFFSTIATILSPLKEQKNIATRNVSWPRNIHKMRLRRIPRTWPAEEGKGEKKERRGKEGREGIEEPTELKVWLYGLEAVTMSHCIQFVRAILHFYLSQPSSGYWAPDINILTYLLTCLVLCSRFVFACSERNKCDH